MGTLPAPVPPRHLTRRSAVLSVVGLAAGASGLWAWRQGAVPEIVVPPQGLPTPNGYERLVAAAGMLRRPEDVDRFFRPDAAGEAAPPRGEVRALLSDNAACLRAVRDALPLPAVAPHRGAPVDHYFAEWPAFRKVARLLVIEGKEREAEGDHTGAAGSYLDAVELGHRVPSGTVLIGRLVGIACEGIGRKPLWPLVERLDGAAAKAAALRLETMHAARVPFAETMEEERYFGLNAWRTYLGDPARLARDSRPVDAEDYDPDAPAEPSEVLRTRLLLLRHGRANLVAAYDRYMAEIVRRCRLPYAEAARLPAMPEPRDPFNSQTLGVFPESRLQDMAASEVQNALLAAALAVRAFREEHGAAPERLEELRAAGCLRGDLLDPFSADGAAPLRYRRDGAEPVLYSVGPDGKDDKGRAIDNAADAEGESLPARSPLRRSVQARSRGDIVAGINTH